MSGWSHATTARRSPVAVHPGRAEEVVTFEHDALGRRVRRASRARRRAARGRGASGRCTSRTASTQSPSGVTLSPPWLCTTPSGGAAVSGLGLAAAPAPVCPGRRRTRPAGPTGPRRRRHRPRGPGTRDKRSPAVLVDATADAHTGRRMIGRRAVAGAHEDDPARLGRPGLQPVEGLTVRTKL